MFFLRRQSTTKAQRHGGKPKAFLFDSLRASVSPGWVLFLMLIAPNAVQAQTIAFSDITAQAGIRFTHNNGAFGKKWLPETMGPGCAFIDYDNDGWPDILLVNGTDFPGHAKSGATACLPIKPVAPVSRTRFMMQSPRSPGPAPK